MLEDRSRFELTAWETFVLAFYFAGILELVIILPKKNGKTTLLAALALYHLLMVEAAECVVGASSADQAMILHRQAVGLVERSNLHRRPIEGQDRHERTRYEGFFDIKPGSRQIRFEAGRIRVLAADANTADGVIPTLALVDELHRHPSGDLYGVFFDGLGPRNGQIITISTPGATEASKLGELRARAVKLRGSVKGKRRVYESADFVLVEWGLQDTDDPENLRMVKMANPAPWQTPAKLRQRRDSPSMTAFQWRRFAAGMWTGAEEAWLEPAVWKGLRVDVGGVKDGDRLVVCIRVGAGAGIGLVSPRAAGAVAVRAVVVPEPERGRISLEQLEFTIRRLTEVYKVEKVLYDAGQFVRSAEFLKQQGIPMEEVPQTPARLEEATGTLWRLISSGMLCHDGDEVTTAQVLAGVTKETEAGWRLVPTDRTRALIAIAMASHETAQLEQVYWAL